MTSVGTRGSALSHTSRAVVAATFLMMAGEGAINPVLPLFGKALGASVAVVGVLIAASGASRVVANFPAGRVADAIGRRPLLVFGPLVTLAAALLAAAAANVWQLGLMRLLAGVGMAAFMTGSITVLSDIEDEAERLHAIGAYRAVVIFGVLVGPVAGGLTAEWAGHRAAFLLQGLMVATASLASHVWLSADRVAGAPSHDRRVAWHIEMRTLFANRDLVLVSLVTFSMFFTITGARQAIIPLLGEERLGLGAGGVGLLFGVISFANLLSIYPAIWLGRRRGPKPVIVVSGLVSASSLLVFTSGHHATAFVLGGVLMGVGSGLAGPTSASYAAGVAPSEGRGSAMGLYQTVGDSGFVVGPLLLGWVAASAGFGAGLILNAVLSLVMSLAFALVATGGSGRGQAIGPV